MEFKITGTSNIAGSLSLPATIDLVVTGRLNIGIDGCVETKGALVNNGIVTIASSSIGKTFPYHNTGSAGSLITRGSVTGTGTYDIARYLCYKYSNLSAPIPDAQKSIFSPLRSLRYTNEKLATSAQFQDPLYVYTPTPYTLEAGRGYVLGLWGNTTTHFISNKINTGDITTFELTRQSVNQSHTGWNLIGNPYPCGLSIEVFLNKYKDYIEPWVLLQGDHSNVSQGVRSLINENGVVRPETEGVDFCNEEVGVAGIHPVISNCQAFYVVLKEGVSSLYITFDDSMKVKSRNDCYFY